MKSKLFLLTSFLTILILLTGLFAQISPSKAADSFYPVSEIESNSVSAQVTELEGSNQAETTGELTLVSSNEREVIYEIKVPWQQLTLEPVMVDGKDYSTISLPGWSQTAQPGSPALPVITHKIGAPFEAEIEISVIPGTVHTRYLSSPVLPVVTQETIIDPFGIDFTPQALPETNLVYNEDPKIYSRNLFYPVSLSEKSADGVIRQQRVVGISVYPIQYNPAKMELQVYETLQIKVTFKSSVATKQTTLSPDSDIYEKLLENELLNYETAKIWRDVEGSLTDQSEFGSLISSDPWSPPSPGWRVKVQADGFYMLSYAELAAVNLPVTTLNPKSFQMFNLGQEVAIQVIGEEDGQFNETDYIVFYGQDIESKYTKENVYWLTYGSVSQGLRITERDGTPANASTPSYYASDRNFQGGRWYLTNIPGDPLFENWLWDYLYPPGTPTWTYTFPLAAPYPVNASLHLSLLGWNSNASINPDHHIKVYLNNVEIADSLWDGVTWNQLEIAIPSGVLVSGNNTLSITALLVTGLTYDIIYIDQAELIFDSYFQLESNQLSAPETPFMELAYSYGTAGTWKFEVKGFSTDQVAEVFDITTPEYPVTLTGVSMVPSGSGKAAQFQDTVVAPKDYWVKPTDNYRKVKAIEQDSESNLQSLSNAADHIIITHQTFSTQAETLRAFHEGNGLRAVSVDIQDVYDEFNYGIVDAAAIHDFLAFAYANWQSPAPSFVVLFGDGHYDPKNYMGYGRISYIPPYLADIDPWIGETAADNRYVTVSGTDIMPDLMLGRLSVNSTAEAAAYVNKIIAYEQTPILGDWQSQVLAVADNADSGGNFASISDNLLSCCLPSQYTASRVYLGTVAYPLSNPQLARDAIMSNLNNGKLLVNYIGHGYTSGWASETLFTINSVPSLTNGGKQPVVLAMTCQEGYFQHPYPYTMKKEALGEVVTRADGRGAIASWSPTGQGVSSGHDYLNRGFYNALFIQGVSTMGEATLAGKLNLWSVGASPDLLDTYTLFGDPALVIARPVKAVDDAYEVQQNTTLTVPAPGVLDNDVDSDGDPLTATKVSDPLHGTLNLNANGSFTYIPASDFFGTDSFRYKATDGTFQSNVATVTITVTGVGNSPPLVSDIPNQTITEGSNFTTINLDNYVADPDNPDSELTWTYSGNTQLSVSIVSRVATISVPNLDWNDSETITFRATDPGTLWDEDPATFTVTAVNDAPVNIVPGAQSTPNDQQLIFTESNLIAVTDVDVNETAGGKLRVTLSVDHALLTLSRTDGLTFSSGDGIADMLMTFQGSLVNINAALDGLLYVPNSTYVGEDTLTIETNDLGYTGTGGAMIDIDFVSITITSSYLTHTIPLYSGWNLVSFRLQPLSTSISDVLSTINGNYLLVYAWDALSQTWLVYDPADPGGSTLSMLDESMGFWVRMQSAADLVVTGTAPSITSIPIKVGWNLVGYPSLDPIALPTGLSDKGVTDYSLVHTYIANQLEPWKLFDRLAPPYANNLSQLSSGFGYWIKVNTESIWTVTYDLP